MEEDHGKQKYIYLQSTSLKFCKLCLIVKAKITTQSDVQNVCDVEKIFKTIRLQMEEGRIIEKQVFCTSLELVNWNSQCGKQFGSFFKKL